ncbi:FtsX-like permease family protein [uncultured Eubacterium sp.]|uniref:FtsX-like permease family protein n=1 Tax=uncultured Eubacterium sp. TaxID=165185 RepID=UPI0026DB8E41|nr:FtsX-like permease family protein [uncultured Eubacterium sp.]
MKALRKEFYVQIKKTFGRFLSLLLIVALGVAFYAGIRSTEPDMRKSVDAIYDKENIYDIRVVSELGVTNNDINALKSIDEIKDIEGIYNVDQVVKNGETEYTVKMMSRTDTINKVKTNVNELSDDECLVDRQLAEHNYIKVGDKITVDNEYVKGKEYTVKGTFCTGNYLSFHKGSSTVGSGKLDGLIIINKNQFDMDNFSDIYITLKGAKKLDSYGTKYEKYVDKVTNKIKKVAPAMEQKRYEEIVDVANEEIQSAQEKIDKNYKKYEKGLKKADDGQKEIEENSKKIEEGESELKKQEKEYKSGVEQYNKGEKQYESASIKLKEGEKEYKNGQKQYESGYAKYKTGVKELESGKNDLNNTKKRFAAMGMSDVPQVKSQIESAQSEISKHERQLNKAKIKLDKSKKKLDKAKKSLIVGKQELKKSRAVLDNTKEKLETGKQKLADGKKEITDGKNEIIKAQKKVDKAYTKLAKAQKKLNKAQRKVDKAKDKVYEIEKKEWYVLDRQTVVSFVEFGQDAERIGNIGKVFPLIFFLVAAMVSLTTMTRMVEEERVQIGTLKALGYGKGSIAGKYIAYGAVATIAGGIIGGIAGSKTLPWIIITAYRLMYQNLYIIEIPINGYYFVTACLAAAVSVIGATILACYKALMEQPASLMQQEAPKAGKRVLLERIPFIWNHLSFNIKSTFRNLFRYKKRLFMTLFGIGGCMALMLVGFGVKNSINSILTIQFDDLFHYDLTVTYDDEWTKKNGTDELKKILNSNSDIKDNLQADVLNYDVGKGNSTVSTYIVIPESTDDISKYVTFKSRTKNEKYKLNDDGVLISEKMAKKIGAKVGDEIYFKESDTVRYNVKVSAIIENYSYHYMYMTGKYYKQITGKDAKMNTAFCILKKGRVIDDKIGNKIMSNDGVAGVSFLQTTYNSFSEMMKSMDTVVIVLVFSAGLLAFIVLYNLNNINIAERRRELATFKVLGFYDMEVSGYIYRENVIITILGIIIGIGFGIILHQFVIQTAEIDMVMFGRNIGTRGYIYSTLLTILFAVIINISMHFKLKKVDMATSLKSGE